MTVRRSKRRWSKSKNEETLHEFIDENVEKGWTLYTEDLKGL